MNTFDAIRGRRAVKHYDPEFTIPDDQIAELKDLIRQAPTSFNREWQQRDEAMRSVGIAAQTIMLSAKAMGYDSCPMIGFDADAVGELINLPGDHVVGMMIAVGKTKTPAQSKGGYLPDSEIFFEDKF